MFRKLNSFISFCCALFGVLLLSLPWVNAAEPETPPPQPWQIDGILAALDDPYPEVWRPAFEKLAEYDAEDLQTALEKPEEIAQKAARILEDEAVDSDIRRSAAEALGNLGEAATPHIPEILTFLQDETVDSDIRSSAAEALGNLGEAVTPHIPVIISILQDETVDSRVRRSAAEALGNLGDAAKPHIPAILSILQDETVDSGVRSSAAEALGNLGDAAKPHIPVLLSLLQNEKVNFYVRTNITEALSQLRDTTAVPVLLNLLQDKTVDPNIRESVAKALGNLGDTTAVPVLLNLLLKKEIKELELNNNDAEVWNQFFQNSDLRSSFAEALGNLGDTTAVPVLLNLLQDNTENLIIRESVAWALGQLGDTAAVPVLLNLLQNNEANGVYFRSNVIQALGQLGDAAVIQELFNILKDTTANTTVRDSFFHALSSLDNAAAVRELLNILKDDAIDSNLRRYATEALIRLADPTTIPELLNILKDDTADSNLRRYAMEALIRLADPTTIPELLNILKDDTADSNLRRYATEALGNIRQLKTEEVIVILDKLYYYAQSDVANWRFRTYFLGCGTEEVKTLLTWLGRPKTRPDELTHDEGIKTLKLFNKIWEPTAELEQLRPELARQIANVAKKTPWQLTDLPLLQSHYNNLKQADSNLADTLQTIIINLKGRQQLLKFGLTLLAHLAFWIGLIFLYPKSPHVQAIFFWNPWVRRIGGVGYVGFCLTWVPFLRRKLFEPFEPSLLADAGLAQFQSLGYFPTSRVTQRGDATPQPITAAIPRIHKQVVLFGDSGLGKSMFLRHLVETKTSRRITVYLPARKCEKGVIEAIQAKLHGQARDAAFLKNLIYSGALDICIDGLNEVTADTRAQITQFVENHFQGNIIMTTQPLEWMPPSTAKLYDLHPLSEEQVGEFLVSREQGKGDCRGKAFEQNLISETISNQSKCFAPSACLDTETRGCGEGNTDYETACRRYLAAALCPNQPPEELTAARRILSNPMDLTLIAQMLAQGKQPDLFHLQQQQYAQMAAEYYKEWGHEFPLKKFSAAVYQRRLDDNPALPAEEFYQELTSLEDEKYKMVLSRQWQEGEGKPKREWYFRHDKIMDFFLVQNFLGDGDVAASRLVDHMNDPRFRGVYFLLATLMPLAEARELREQLIQYAADSKDHTVSDTFVQLLRTRK